MTFGSLFAGIGGIDLGLERAGMQCRWQVENDRYCQRILAKHWPDVGRWDDVRTFPPAPAEDWTVDLIAGGFPCQDISIAAGKKRKYLDGQKSGLWFEMERIIGALRPTIVIVENTPTLVTRGLDRILGSMASRGYDAEWEIISASAVGAPQLRERLFLLCYANNQRKPAKSLNAKTSRLPEIPNTIGRNDNNNIWTAQRQGMVSSAWNQGTDQPIVLGVADGVPNRVDRLRCLGNAVVPQVAEWIGRMIMQGEQ